MKRNVFFALVVASTIIMGCANPNGSDDFYPMPMQTTVAPAETPASRDVIEYEITKVEFARDCKLKYNDVAVNNVLIEGMTIQNSDLTVYGKKTVNDEVVIDGQAVSYLRYNPDTNAVEWQVATSYARN